MWGAIHRTLAVEPKDAGNDQNFLVMGPWRHSQTNYNGTTLGPMTWRGDTALEFRRDVLKPFFDQYLKEGAPKASTPPVFIYNTGENHWDRFPSWPLACESGCATASKPLYLTSAFGLSFQQGSAASRISRRLRRVRLGSGQARAVHPAAGPVRRRRRLAPLAADGSALRRRSSRCPELRDAGADRARARQRRAGRASGGVHERHRRRLGREADRRLSRRSPEPARDGRLPARDRDGHLPRPVSRELRDGRRRFRRIRRCRSRSRCRPRTTSSCPATASWCRCSPRWFPLYDRNPQTFVPNIFLAKSVRLSEGDDPDISR